MQLNPYDSPQFGRVQDPTESRIKLPALALAMVASMGLAADFLVTISFTLDFVRIARLAGVQEAFRQGWLILLGIILLAGAHAFILFGAIRMSKCECYAVSVVAASLSLVPVVSPGCVLGIPVGAWCLTILLRREVRESIRGKTKVR